MIEILRRRWTGFNEMIRHRRFDDEYARDILSGLGSEGSGIAQELWKTKTKRSFERSAPASEIGPGFFGKKDRSYFACGTHSRQAPAIRIEKGSVLPSNAQNRTGHVPLPYKRALALEFSFRMEPKRLAGPFGRQTAHAGRIAVRSGLSGDLWLPLSDCE
jgi:hypothetical protein